VAVAKLSIGVLVGLAPAGVARFDQAQLDPRVLLFMGAIVLIAVFVSGLMPALRLSRSSPQQILQESGRGADESRGSRRLRGALVVVEVALAIVLLVGSGLMVRTLVGLVSIDPGFRTADVLTFRVSLPREAYTTREQRADFYDRLFRDLRSLPGVNAVGINHALPFGGVMTGTRMTAVGSTQTHQASWQAVSPDYFQAMTIPILRGRTFANAEMVGTMQHAVVSRSLAERLWGTDDPLGRQVVLSGNTTPLTVVGVAGETRNGTLDRAATPVIYVPVMPRAGTIVLSCDSHPDAFVPSIRTALQRVDPVVAPSDVRLMEERVSGSYAVRRFTALLLGVFASVAAFLGAVGLYGVISFAVGRRTREIGIRRALGAQRISIAGLVLGQALRLVAAGLVIGLVAAYGLTRLLATLLFEVSPTDVLTFVAVSFAMVVVAAVACVVPARRAMRLDPATSLRNE
jgi:putative ABC transport system permease protein